MSKRAVILAGGKGTRLKPYTIALPKPLVPIGGTPILEIIIKQLVKFGFDHITITVNHMADIIKAFFGDGSKWNIKIDYSLENKPLSTMGPLKLINDLPEDFLVMNGDVLTDMDFREFYNNHIMKNSIFTVSTFKRTHKIDYGVIEIDENNKLYSFDEKPMITYNVSMGVYMANREILKYIPEDVAYGFDNLMSNLIILNKSVSISEFRKYWLDIGRPEDYEQACIDINNIKF